MVLVSVKDQFLGAFDLFVIAVWLLLLNILLGFFKFLSLLGGLLVNVGYASAVVGVCGVVIAAASVFGFF